MRTRAVYKYAFDETFFESVDTEEKAYWLGFIAADGCIRRDNGHNAVQVKLKAGDAAHLEKLKIALGLERPLLMTEAKGVAGSAATLSFSSRKLIDDLERYGVGPRKSLTLKPWQGPDALMRHYWRGMVDGDGMISSSGGKWTVLLCGTQACVEAFEAWSKIICQSTGRPWTRDSIWYWKVSGTRKPRLLASALYKDAKVHLDRKADRAQALLALGL